ncbi:AAA family ATPase, partial [bacterium]
DLLRAAKSRPKKYPLEITAHDITQTVVRVTGIPQSDLLTAESKNLISLEKNLKKLLVGQDQALKLIASSIRRSRAGISNAGRPIGSFMILGPSGVGKTLLAKLLARELFQTESALIRIDMSELMERHNVARLIGAPAGYVGYGEGGRLTEAIRRRPYAVLLLDEIEKAHADVFNLLLQILEEGELTDAAGKKANFRNTLILMTSNLGLSTLNKWAQGFGFADSGKRGPDEAEIKAHVEKMVRNHFKPEFLNRLDKIIVMNPLTSRDIKKIVKIEFQKLQERISERKIALKLDTSALNHLTKISFDPEAGARLVQKNLQNLVEDQIADKLLKGALKEKDRAIVTFTAKTNSLEIKKQ